MSTKICHVLYPGGFKPVHYGHIALMNKYLNSKESFYLALALSLDSLAVGFGSSLCSINYLQTLILCFIIGVLAVSLGVLLGQKFSEKLHLELSWLSGVLLIVLAIVRVLK